MASFLPIICGIGSWEEPRGDRSLCGAPTPFAQQQEAEPGPEILVSTPGYTEKPLVKGRYVCPHALHTSLHVYLEICTS